MAIWRKRRQIEEDRAGGSEKLPLRQDKSFKNIAGVLVDAALVRKEHKFFEFVQDKKKKKNTVAGKNASSRLCLQRHFFSPNKSGSPSAVWSDL